jgi:hypothetical protein
MMPHPNATLVGSAGVSLLLVAFFLNLFKLMRSDRYPYMLLNLTGGALACYSSYLINFLPFVILEGTWALVAAAALCKRLLRRSTHTTP